MTSTTSLVHAIQPAEPSLLKTDVLGRMQRTREQRERILDEFERSGVSGPKFAVLCGVKYQTFATWVQRRKRKRQIQPKRAPERRSVGKVQWMEAQVRPSGPPSGTGLMLQLPGGVCAEITTSQHVPLAAALVRALEKPC